MDREKHIDESWKDAVSQEKELGQQGQDLNLAGASESAGPEELGGDEPNPMEVNFINYVSSLVFQTMIFLGEMPNPITNETEKNLAQAKFLIDTLLMMREKTKGNLTKPEENLISSAVYELQVRFVDLIAKENPQGGA